MTAAAGAGGEVGVGGIGLGIADGAAALSLTMLPTMSASILPGRPPAAAAARRLLFCAVAAVGGISLTASPSEACKKRHQTPFELFDVAATVAHVKVAAVPAPLHVKNRPGPGDVRLDVVKLLKAAGATAVGGAAGAGTSGATGGGASGAAGAPASGRAPRLKPSSSPSSPSSPSPPSPPAQLVSHLGNTSCDVPFAVGDTALIFLDAAGWTEGAHEGYLRAVTSWQPVIEAWAQAKDVAGRAAVLVDAATGTDAAVRQEAATFLVDEPALLAALDADQRGRLVARLGEPGGAKEPELALALIRLRERAAISKLPRWMKLARAVGAVTRYEAERDPSTLAQAILAARKPAERWAAFERCERARSTRLASFRRYIDDLDRVTAEALATSCREGKPLER